MERTEVKSSQIHSIGYDEQTQTLEVAFKVKADPRTVRVYQYRNVPVDVYQNFMAADSKGSYLHKVIKRGGFEYQYIGEDSIADAVQSEPEFAPPKVTDDAQTSTTRLLDMHMTKAIAAIPEVIFHEMIDSRYVSGPYTVERHIAHGEQTYVARLTIAIE